MTSGAVFAWESEPEPPKNEWPALEDCCSFEPGDFIQYTDDLGVEREYLVNIICPNDGGVHLLRTTKASLGTKQPAIIGADVQTDVDSIEAVIESDSGALIKPPENNYDSYWDGRVVVYE